MRLHQPKRESDEKRVSWLHDDVDDDDILFMLSNIIKYMHCTMKHKKETQHNDERWTCRKYRESWERKKREARPRYL